MKACPSCNRLVVVPIIYGKPTFELIEAAENGLCLLGGCAVQSESPNWHCKSCNFKWYSDDSGDSKATTSLNEVRQIVNSNLFPIFTGMVLAGVGSNYSISTNSLTDYGRLKSLLNIDHGISEEGLQKIQKNCIAYPDIANRVMQLLAHYLAYYILHPGHRLRNRHLGELLFFAAIALTHIDNPLLHDKPSEQSMEDFESFLEGFDFHAE